MRGTRYVLVAAALVLPLGCAPDAQDALGDPGGVWGEVQAAFPRQAPRVLAESAFREARVGDENGFALRTPNEVQGLFAELPGDGADPVRLTLPDGLQIQILEKDAVGRGRGNRGMVAYARRGGVSLWSGMETGVEEWLYLPAGTATREVGDWAVTGGTLKQHGTAVDVYDSAGKARLTIAAPEAFAASGEAVSARVEARGQSAVLLVDRVGQEALLVDPVFVAAGSMTTAREAPQAVVLPSGRVLMVGGIFVLPHAGNYEALKSAEIYDPATGTWSPTAPSQVPRFFHTLTMLDDGRALVVGSYGQLNEVVDNTVTELFDEGSEVWASTSPLNEGRAGHTAVLMNDGRLLVTGGTHANTSPRTEAFDPSTEAWGIPAEGAPRQLAPGVLLEDGRALVMGGLTGWNTAELYDPPTNTWSSAPNMNMPLFLHAATRLIGGKVLVTGGHHQDFDSTMAAARIYDPAVDMWQATSPMGAPREAHRSTVLFSGLVLITGGRNGIIYTKTTELYDPNSNTWAPGPNMSTVRVEHSSIRIPDGRVLIAGGWDGFGSLASCDLFSGTIPTGDSCVNDEDCVTFHCVDQVCCSSACDQGPCDACSVATGAAANGACVLLSGPACDDGNACTLSDVCAAGACVGEMQTCPVPANECHEQGSCEPTDGECTEAFKADGSPCSSGECKGGECVQVATGAGGSGGSGGDSGTGASGGAASGGGNGGSSSGSAGGTAPVSDDGTSSPASGDCACRARPAHSETEPSEMFGVGGVLLLGIGLRLRRNRRTSFLACCSAVPKRHRPDR